MLLKLAWRNIWRNSRRSLITIASIMFAVFFAIIARSFQLGMYEKMISSMVEYNTGYIQLHKKGYWDDQTIDNSLPEFDTEKIEAIEEVEAVVPRLEGYALSSYKDQTKAAKVVGIDPYKEDQMTKLQEKLIDGKYISEEKDQALVTEGLASYYNLAVGDTLYLIGQGYHAMTAAGRYVVGGIVEFGHPVLNEATVYLNMKEAQWFFSADKLLSSYVIDLTKPRAMEALQASIKSEVDTAKIEVMNWQEMMPEMVQTIEIDSAGGILMIFILYMVVSFGIFGTILMMTAERKTEYGVMIAIGMKRWKLSLTTFLEVILLAVLGSLMGLLLSSPIVYYFHYNPIVYGGQAGEAIKEYGFEPVIPTSIDFDIALTHSIMILVIAILLALYPIFYINKLKTVNAMRG